MSYSQDRVRELIRDIRSRWRRRAVLQGAAVTVGVLAVWGILTLLLHWTFGLPPLALLIVAAIGGVVVIGLAVQFVIRPALQRISDQQIALLVEERVPELEDRLNSAVEIEDTAAARRAHGVLVDRLIDDAAHRARTVPLTTVVDRHRERLLTAASAVGLVLFLFLGYATLDELRISYGTEGLASLVPAATPYMTVDPGNVEVEKGASQEVVVTLRDETDREVVINYRDAEGQWQKASMQPAIGEPAYLHEFISVQEPMEYFVEHDQQRSDVFNVSLYTFPAVSTIDLTYTYPEYTGRAPYTEENTGDIFGLRGASVTVDVSTTGEAAEGELVLDDDTRIPLTSTGAGHFRATMTLNHDGFYRVRLVDREEKENKFPEEHQIVPFDDQRPRITITDPQRDVRANAIEEVLMAVQVEDDFGIEDVRLRYAVNANEEQTVTLKEAEDDRPTEVEGEHLFFLEDYSLEPGDVISYFVEAEDGRHETAEASDMYFIEVIPFDQEYSQVTAGGMQGGGGQQSAIVINQQQIIAATWKLHRERPEMASDEFQSSLRALVQAQDNLRRNIEERISGTAFSLELQMDETNRRIAELLRTGVDAMGRAINELGSARLRDALTPEREALNALLRADALNTEQRVALNRGGQSSGGGGGGATEERMTELMDLELDISKDKYEVLPQSSAQSGGGGGEMDEALQKIRELSRRQQNLANQSRNELEGEDQRRQVEQLRRDQEDLQQEAQRLAQEMATMSSQSNPSGEQSRQQLERISRNMEEAERALREGDVERAQTRQQQAINDLESMSRDMRMATNDDRREALQEMDREFDTMREQEDGLAEGIDRAVNEAQAQNGRLNREDLEELAERRRASWEALQRFQEQLDRVAEENADEPELASAARNLRQGLRRESLDQQMEDSESAIQRGWLDNAQRRQESIQQGMERLEEEMRAFEGHLPVTDEERLARSVESLRQLERDLQRLRQESQAQNQGQNPGQGEQQGQSEGQSEQGQGQQQGQGEGQGEQGQGQQQDQGESQGQGQGQGDRSARADAAGRQARLDSARERIQRMQEDLQGTGADGSLDALGRAVARADNWNRPLEGDEAREFFEQQIFAPLSQLEEALMRELDRIGMARKLHGSRPGNVPPEYRDLVERYYESLSKSTSP